MAGSPVERSQELELQEAEQPDAPGQSAQVGSNNVDEANDDEDDVPPATPEKNGAAPDMDATAARADARESLDDGLEQTRMSLEEVSLSANDTAGPPNVPANQIPTRPAPGPSPIPSNSSSTAGPSTAPSMRRSSTAYSTTSTSRGSLAAARKPLLQGVLVINAFEAILGSKDAKRNPALKESAQRALDILKAPQGTAANANEDRREEVFEPLKLACATKTNALMITALDTIGKLVSYGFFNPPHAQVEDGPENENGLDSMADESFVRDEKSEKLSDSVVDAICDCFIESPSGPAVAALQAAANSTTTPDAVNLQIVKALLTLVLQDANGQGLTVHQSSLVSRDNRKCNQNADIALCDSSKPCGQSTIYSCSRKTLPTRWSPKARSIRLLGRSSRVFGLIRSWH